MLYGTPRISFTTRLQFKLAFQRYVFRQLENIKKKLLK